MACIADDLIGILLGILLDMHKKLPPDYDAIEILEWAKNAKEVSGELESNSPRLLERIQLFVARFNFAKPDIEKKIGEDPMFAAHFAKEPRRTGFHERVAAEWISSLPMVNDFETLPKGGKNAIYITGDGNVHKGELANRPGKSLDFKWRTGNTTCYAMHKYTKEGGGNQDSQHKEMIANMKAFMSCNDKTCALFTIVDGPYYLGARIEELRNVERSHPPKSFALPIEDLPEALQQFIVE